MKLLKSYGSKTLAGAAVLIACSLSIAAAEPPANWVEFSAGGVVSSSGDDAAFQRRWGNNGDFYGGIESFHFEQLGEGTTFEIDGHAMFGLEDYELELNYEKDDLGFVRGGYREFRTWYDGSGGYFGQSAARPFVELYDDELSLDRGELWFEAGLRMPDVPEITFGYQHLWRDGEKDSTMWGRTTPPGFSARAYVPSFYDIDEERDIFRLDVAHTLGNTDLGIGLRYDRIRNDDSRIEKRQHITASASDKDRTITNRDVYDADLFSAHFFSETRFDERTLLSFGYSFTTMDTDVDGTNRVYNITSSTRDHGYRDVIGGSQLGIHVANAAFWWNPIDDLVIVPSIRAEWEDISSAVFFTETAGTSSGGTTPFPATSMSDYALEDFTEEIEIRYSGLENLLLYGRAEWRQGDGDWWISEFISPDPTVGRMTEGNIDSAKYVIGANWYPAQGLSVAAQYYHESFDQDFDQVDLGLTPMMREHSYETNDANIRLTWRALPNLTLVTRYDYQQTEFDNLGFNPALRGVESGDITRHILTESVTWNASDRFYLQGSFHWISAETETGYDAIAGSGYSPNYDNDYWSASLNAGYALTKSSALEAGFFYYGADNLAASKVSMPYGTIANEWMVSLGYVQQVTENMSLNVRYGFYKGEDDAFGGYNNYEAHVVSTGIRMSF